MNYKQLKNELLFSLCMFIIFILPHIIVLYLYGDYGESSVRHFILSGLAMFPALLTLGLGPFVAVITPFYAIIEFINEVIKNR